MEIHNLQKNLKQQLNVANYQNNCNRDIGLINFLTAIHNGNIYQESSKMEGPKQKESPIYQTFLVTD